MMDENNPIVDELVEITFPEKDDFLKIRETLSRIGVASRKEQELFQSCHILHKRGKYYITHFKELFKLDGKPTSIDESDIGRRNTIVKLLEQWKLLSVVDETKDSRTSSTIITNQNHSFQRKKSMEIDNKIQYWD